MMLLSQVYPPVREQVYQLRFEGYSQYYLTFLFNFVPYVQGPRFPDHTDYRRKIYAAFQESVTQIMLIANLEPADFQLELDCLPNFDIFVPQELRFNNPNRLEFITAFKQFAMALYLQLHGVYHLPMKRTLLYLPLTITAMDLVFKIGESHD